MVSFTIPGRLGGKGRPRVSTRSGKIRAFTPAKTVATEAMVREFASSAMAGRDLLSGPVGLDVLILLQKPASWSKKKRAAATWATCRIDADNRIKALGDAMNGIVFRDDSQIAVIHFEQRYTDGAESVRVSIHDLSAEPFARAA